jgi:hypothetical protein
MYQVTRRTLDRLLHRRELWNGNRESWRQVLRWDPQKSIIRWAWTTHGTKREWLDRFEADLKGEGVTCVRVRSHREAEAAIGALLGAVVGS